LELEAEGGSRLAFTNARRLGRLRLRMDPPNESPVSALGFDPLLDLPDAPAFARRLSTRRGTVKAALLDQSFAAGVGNWMADEVLFQAGIDPGRTVPSLTDPEVRRIRAKLGHVVRHAVRVDADKDRLPDSWLFHHRWGRDAAAKLPTGERVEHRTVAGRTTAWVPERQR
jgi:formamidopyrimidine-DNA glycosylase